MTPLEELFKNLHSENKTHKTRVGKITKLLGVSKRGSRVIKQVNTLLDKYELKMRPEYHLAGTYSTVEIYPKPKMSLKSELKKPKYDDTIPRIGIIKSANLRSSNIEEQRLISISKESSILEATSLMIYHNYSQLPIIAGKRDVAGIISWRSIGKALSLGKACKKVSDCCEPVDILDFDEPLFKAVKKILKSEVVLVRNQQKEISGIITTTDLGQQFLILSESFLLIEQIENFIRIILDEKLTYDDITKILNLEHYDKEISHISDLTFGHYVRIFENENLFNKININVDRNILKQKLAAVNKIRNEVMHFNPEALEENDLFVLRQTQSFLHQVIENR